MTTSFFRRVIFLLLVIAVFPFIALSQAPQDRFAKLDTMRVHYQNYGEGKEAIVFIHGWSCGLKYWKANIPAFVNQSRVIVSQFLMMDEPQKFNDTVLAFLKKNKLIKN